MLPGQPSPPTSSIKDLLINHMAEPSVRYTYNDPRLSMTLPGRFIVRLVTYCGYGVMIVGGLVAWGSPVSELHAVGALLLLFLISRVVSWRMADRSLARLPTAGVINIANYTTPETYLLIERAFDKALVHGGDVTLYILQSLTERPEIKQILIRLDVDPESFSHKVDQYSIDSQKTPRTKGQVLVAVEELMIRSFDKAAQHYGSAIKPHYLFGALGDLGTEYSKRLFVLFNISTADIETAFIFGKGRRKKLRSFLSAPLTKRHRVMNRAWTARPTPTLDAYSVDVTDLMRDKGGWLLIGHEAEYDRLVRLLCRPGNPNALLVGESGSGKRSIVNYLAFQIANDRVPAQLFDHRLVALSMSDLMAGASAAEVQTRLKKVVEEIIIAGNVILCIPDIHLLLKHEGAQLSGADVIVPAIKSGAFSVIGGTYPKEFKQYVETDHKFAARFEAIRVAELSEADSVRYLVYASLVLESATGVTITFRAIKEAVRIAHKYFHTKLLPSSAEDLIKEALAGASLRHAGVLRPDDIIATAEQKVNIKMHSASGDEVAELLNLEATIHQRFIDQEEAVTAVASALRQYRAGVARKGGPIASFLFCGPTGVGKTELSKILANTQFGSTAAMVRFDMSEYQDKQSFYRLIGSPDGSLRGALTEAVMERPYSLILLDEFEKAYPDILNLFLQVLDDGRLTDNLGRTVDFQNTIVIATSNAHSTLIKEQLEQGSAIATITDLLKKHLTDYFKPELINRFSRVVVFKPLSREDIVAVARLNLAELSKTLSEAQAVTLTFDESAVQEIAARGFDPVFGARPLRQAINDSLRGVLAEKILRGSIARGQFIQVSYRAPAFIFETRA